jgi:hypothetical protein
VVEDRLTLPCIVMALFDAEEEEGVDPVEELPPLPPPPLVSKPDPPPVLPREVISVLKFYIKNIYIYVRRCVRM